LKSPGVDKATEVSMSASGHIPLPHSPCSLLTNKGQIDEQYKETGLQGRDYETKTDLRLKIKK
jgi:hypothetical protein